MLIEFGGENFSSFKEGFLISFDMGKKCPLDVSNGDNISNLICIKGANSSGKTNILKSLAFLGFFCTNSYSLKPEELIAVDSYFFNNNPTYLYCLFEINKSQYKYEVELNKNSIISESLTKRKKREVYLFKREKNELKYAIKDISNDLKNRKSIRNNASIISILHQAENKSLSDAYNFFNSICSNVKYHGLQQDFLDESYISNMLFNDKKMLNFVTKCIQEFEPTLKKIRFTEQEIDGVTIASPIFDFSIEDKIKSLSYHHQSSGIKSLYKQLPLYRLVIKLGGVLILDEFDINLHPHILPFLTNLFSDNKINTKKAQLLFTSHNNEIMDRMTKYRTYLVDKYNNESYAYRLDEITGSILRNDRQISKPYNQAKLGGVPNQHWSLDKIW